MEPRATLGCLDSIWALTECWANFLSREGAEELSERGRVSPASVFEALLLLLSRSAGSSQVSTWACSEIVSCLPSPGVPLLTRGRSTTGGRGVSVGVA